MLNTRPSSFKWSVISVALATVAALCISVRAQEAAKPAAPGAVLVDDWTHHHVVFSNPGTKEDAERTGTLDRWLKVTSDPRYQLQQAKRALGARPATAAPDLGAGTGVFDPIRSLRGNRGPHTFQPQDGIKKDWSAALGGSAGTISGSANTDVVYAISTTYTVGSNSTATVNYRGFFPENIEASPPIAAQQIGTFTAEPANGSVTIKEISPANTLTLTPSGTAGTGTATVNSDPRGGDTITVGSVTYTWHASPRFCGTMIVCVLHGGSAAQDAANLEAAINDNPAECGFTYGFGFFFGGGSSCFYNISVPNANATAVDNGNVVTVINETTTALAFTTGGGDGAVTVSPNPIPASTPPSSGSPNSCSSSTVGTFENSTSTAVLAVDLATAIAACDKSYPAVGVTATSSGNTVIAETDFPGTTVPTNATLGTVSNTSFSWSGSWSGGKNCADTNGEYQAGSFGFPPNPPTFCYWNSASDTYDTASVIATNIEDAFNANGNPLYQYFGIKAAITGTCTTSSTSCTLTFTPAASVTTSASNFSAFVPGTNSSTPGVLATVQPNAVPAYSFSQTAGSSSDFVVYPTGWAGSGSQANIIAYTNLYPGPPSTDWAYNTDTGYSVSTSPILSLTGTQVAFVESSATGANLVILTPTAGAGTLTAPATPTTVTKFALGATDSYSAPYCDYTNNVIYVGDDNGNLHQFKNVFNGTPTAGWTALVSSTSSALASAVYDAASGDILVGDFDGSFYAVSSSDGSQDGSSVANVGQISADAIPDGPLVDSSAGMAYVFVGDCTTFCSATEPGDDAIFQLPIGASGFPVASPLGQGGAGYYLYTGTFDNAYYTSEASCASNCTPTGHIYTVGDTGSTGTGATLYQVAINGGQLGAATAVGSNPLTVSGAIPWPSPVSEYYNSPNDYIFFSVNEGTETGCTEQAGNGCILSYNVSTPSAITYTGGQNYTNAGGAAGCWATGGISIDANSYIYFVSLNGAVAGSAGGNASAACTPTASPDTQINAIQAAQNNP